MPSVSSACRIKYHHYPLLCGCSVPLKRSEHKKMCAMVARLDKLTEDGKTNTKVFKNLRIKAARLITKGQMRELNTRACASVCNVLKRYYN